ncbi:hypothetical protein IMG5_169420 [Ichthyophthirius multifiliis]|uniref:Uncharacterized protein n=1 Tax=Ichthyophthirius multifiliis TaxID=5932 RepID=G0R1B2_ICHMU|nr:hypothetical protein IMG5_169420 [Ichthyophthirius multifiliis]EGR28745.1 hypothetical protein IMG5_169420 [Ichthyophthirius multifiliis]|eukprot:XP_004029981.1 hypothetical protein IMG5_169420 [Ichthyophthirius multifiliis]
MEEQFQNPKHPLDLSIQDLSEIKLLFDQAKLQACSKNNYDIGVSLDVQIKLSIILKTKNKSKIYQKNIRTNIIFKQNKLESI